MLEAGLGLGDAASATVEAEAQAASPESETPVETETDTTEDAPQEQTPTASQPRGSEEEAAAVAELTKQQVVTQYLQDASAFAKVLSQAIPVASQLLGSKTASDATEAVNFLVVAHLFGADGVDKGVRKMLNLIFSKEVSVKAAVLEAYRKLFFTPDPEVYTTPKARHTFVVKNLMQMTAGAGLGDLRCMEELVNTMMAENVISPHVIKLLWEVFAQRNDAPNAEHSQRAVTVLAMAARADSSLIKDNVGVLVSVGLG